MDQEMLVPESDSQLVPGTGESDGALCQDPLLRAGEPLDGDQLGGRAEAQAGRLAGTERDLEAAGFDAQSGAEDEIARRGCQLEAGEVLAGVGEEELTGRSIASPEGELVPAGVGRVARPLVGLRRQAAVIGGFGVIVWAHFTGSFGRPPALLVVLDSATARGGPVAATAVDRAEGRTPGSFVR
jgi:hypothetical protein